MNDTKSLFGIDAAQFIEIVDQLALAKGKVNYSFMLADDYDQVIREDPGRGIQIYWNEILARAHLTAAVSILRSRHWISAVGAAAKNKNLLAFAAAFRGLIESSADTASALGAIPITFAENHVQINRALAGTLGKQFFVSSELKPNQDGSNIAYYLTEYRHTFPELLMFSFNPALVTLNVLNYFSLRTLHTQALLDWNLSSISLWQKCQSKFGDALPLAHKGLRSVKPNPAVNTDAAR